MDTQRAARKALAVLVLLAGLVADKSDAYTDWCPGGCCDCPPIEPPPCFCAEPPCLPCEEFPIPQPVIDNIPPVFHGCPVDMQRTLPAQQETISVCWREPWASDNRGPLHIQPTRQGPKPCSEFREGTHTITYTANDFAGNNAQCQFTITVHAIVCTKLLAPPNARITCSRENRQGSVCQYYCDSHYSLVTGSKQRVCGADGEWSGTQATCEIRRCEVLMTPTNGYLRCRGGDVPGSTCTYHCSHGYHIASGHEVRRCRADGHWSGEEARCEARRCSELSAPANGYVSCTGTRPRSVCHYRCDVGYHIEVGSTSRTCSSEGEWSGAPAICLRRVVNCSPLSAPHYGRISCQGDNQPGSWCQYSCDHGYLLEGDRSRICEDNGRWTGREPSCYPKSCQVLPHPANGRVSCDAHTPGSTCRYSCNSGYSIDQGSDYRTCQQTGVWSGTEAVCVPASCSPLPPPPNGEVNCEGNSYGSRCQYRCNAGYSIGSGSSTRTCESGGRWSGSEVTCVVDGCSPLRDIRNGYIQCQGNNEVGTRCAYFCDEGYSLGLGSQYRDCRPSGRYGDRAEWSGEEPVCQDERCERLDDPLHGYVQCNGNNDVGTRCTYYCNEGYSLILGSQYRDCRSDSRTGRASWTGTDPVCQVSEKKLPCPTIQGLQNAVQICSSQTMDPGVYCDFVCKSGYSYVRGNKRIICRNNGRWSADVDIVCEEETCDALPSHISHGQLACPRMPSDRAFPIRTRCEYRCDHGYSLKPDPTSTVRICGPGGEWSGQRGYCERETSTCRALPAEIVHGRLMCYGEADAREHPVGTRCEYRCDSGYSLEPQPPSSTVRICEAGGGWSGHRGSCVAPSEIASCTPLTPPSNGDVRCDRGPAIGSACTYTCDAAYRLVGGSFARLCLATAEWSGTEPFCQGDSNPCQELTAPPNAVIRCQGQAVDDRCQYRCNSGYKMTSGSPERQCQTNGKWSGSEPVCTEVRCEPLPPPDNGQVVCSGGYSYGCRCDYYCNVGYYVTGGSYTRYCDGRGQWTGTSCSCQPIQVKCSNRNYCMRSCGTRRCSPGATRLKRAIDAVKNRPQTDLISDPLLVGRGEDELEWV